MHVRNMILRRSGHFRPLLNSATSSRLHMVSAASKHTLSGFSQPVMAIRREDQSIWERRAPLAPNHVRKLVKNKVKVLVQPSNRRAYPMKAYASAGAIIQEDISDASLIIGIKKPPVELLLPNKTYCFFSHTIKAQEANMPLLDAILEKNIRLIDYEKMTDSQGARVVAFGKWAGVAGMINILNGLGIRLLALGHHTPFMYIGPAHNYRSSDMAKQVFRDAGYEISLGLMPKSMGPLTFVFTGSGNVSQGAQEMFQELPYEYIEPKDLPKVATHGAINKVYGCVVSRDAHYVRKDGGPFNADEFQNHPDWYSSTFAEKIAPYASCIINGIYWAPSAPRLITIPDAKNLLQPASQPWLPTSLGCPQLPHRLLAICDISADPGGSIEFMSECTTIDKPFCLYDANQHTNTESFAGPGVLVCSIDNMPAQLPREATDFFGALLLPYIPDMIISDATQPFEAYNARPVVKNAVIATNNKLAPSFEYIEELRNSKKKSNSKAMSVDQSSKKVLVLGAGYVASPVVEYLSRDSNVRITVASALRDEAEQLAQKHQNTDAVCLDIQRRPEELAKLIQEHDLCISLLPYGLHGKVADLCIAHHVNMVTASYSNVLTANPDASYHQRAVDADVTILNEMGLDPGIDHLLAMECFDEVKELGGKVTSFRSFCGGLPAPEFSDNPLRYKFSWNPRGVFLAALNGARFIDNGKIVEIPPGGVDLMESVKPFDFLPGFNLEGYSNRDSLHYLKEYGIEGATTCMRGTLRYKGYTDCLIGLMKLGMLQPTPHPALHPDGPDVTWRKLIAILTNQSSNNLLENLKRSVAEKVGSLERLQAVEQLGLFDNTTPVIKHNTPLDTLAHHLAKTLTYEKNERDLVILRHDIGITWPNNTKESREITLVVYGEPNGYTAMAKTVGYPAAIGAKMLLDKEIQRKGLVMPLSKDIYRPVLQRLEQEGIKAVQRTHRFES
ncbi:Alpha-aminoadipic semialdehyde synthase, mitochondrial [Hypsibius exemplaris]|uniref:Alpha-aminoadipic semialdehyde synthase, mitochondrial n=1 Tax=Hypsibius exemplaris TaxID=2072580 RepID=A0A1W0XAA0_HYPEX|nr:Alpha-aminoadipic semialdehyde synthase, mitochondrial [Hypsibius exemplaris]